MIQAQIMLNKDVLQAFHQADPIQGLIQIRDQILDKLTALAGLVSSNLAPYKRLAINALLTIDVHNRDILNSMIDNGITRREDFEWTRWGGGYLGSLGECGWVGG